HGLARQESVLDGLRVRAGTLLTASSIVTAFLGGQALRSHEVVTRVAGQSSTHTAITSLGWAAVGCFLAILAVCIALLLPWQWASGHNIHTLMDQFLEGEPSRSEDDLRY